MGFWNFIKRAFLAILAWAWNSITGAHKQKEAQAPSLRQRLSSHRDQHTRAITGRTCIPRDNPTYTVRQGPGDYNPRKHHIYSGFDNPDTERAVYSFDYPEGSSRRFGAYGRKSPYKDELGELYRSDDRIYEKRRGGKYANDAV